MGASTAARYTRVFGSTSIARARGWQWHAAMSSVALARAFEPERSIYLRGEPNGLALDTHDDALHVVDAHGGFVLRVVAGRPHRLARIDVGATGRLAAATVTPYGTLYVTRVGTDGAVFEIEPDGGITALPLPAQFWRLGLAYDASLHALFATRFVKPPGAPFAGSIARIDLATGLETTLLDGFVKPVGIAKIGSTLVVSDACLRAVFAVELDGDGRVASRTTLAPCNDRPDSLCAFDTRSLLLTVYDQNAKRGTVRRVWLDGRACVIATGAWEPRGVATDRANAYVSVRRGSRVLVLPID
jgi:hypothetical protein